MSVSVNSEPSLEQFVSECKETIFNAIINDSYGEMSGFDSSIRCEYLAMSDGELHAIHMVRTAIRIFSIRGQIEFKVLSAADRIEIAHRLLKFYL